jgi:Ca-activated chloride channel family protein
MATTAYVALASATLGLDAGEQRPLALKIVLDCSGSMGGDTLATAKRALLAILERLKPDDRISLTRFGSSIDQVTDGLEPADGNSLAPLKSRIRQIEADLGGTQMEDALRAALSLATPAGRSEPT